MRPVCALVLLALVGCKTTEDRVGSVTQPRVVTQVVERYRDIPEWATVELPNRAPVDKSVEALVKANNARAATIDRANCERRLLKALDDGKKVDPRACK